jgi:flagellar motility protein MotE (MotC chaperone)
MNIRLLPVVGISASALLALKLLGLVIGPVADVVPIEGAVAQETMPDQQAAAPETPPGGEATVAMPAEGGKDGEMKPDGQTPPEEVPVLPESLEIGGSAAERAVLESLGKRRQDLEKQQGQLDLREKLLQATEERIQKRVEELKKLEKQIEGAVEEKRKQDESEIAGLVTMYESMKPKDAARIFDRLSMPVLLKVVRQMKPRKMADILGKMSAEAAERLTVAIASSTDEPVSETKQMQADLPKIRSN